MIYAILLVGLAMVTSGMRGTGHELGAQLQTDMLGKGGFVPWIIAVLTIGSLGFIAPLRTTSRYLIALLAVVLVVRNGGIWQQAQTALTDASTAGPAPAVALPGLSGGASGNASGGASGGASGSGSAIGGIASDAAAGAAIGGPYGAAAGAAIGIADELF
jgi:hypothetical protein